MGAIEELLVPLFGLLCSRCPGKMIRMPMIYFRSSPLSYDLTYPLYTEIGRVHGGLGG